jgi:DNA polymerase
MNYDAEIMVVGQAPGQDELETGVPFMGKAGKFFDNAIYSICRLDRSDLYVTNIVKCMTPDNRKPKQHEVEACKDFLDKEISLIHPKIIVALGAMAFKRLTGMSGLMKHHGELVWSPRYSVYVIPLMHPIPYNTNNDERRDKIYAGLETLRTFLMGSGSNG